MSELNSQNPVTIDYKPRKGKNLYFRRALRYLYPYRRIVAVSIAAAFLVGVIFTTGLAAMLPILRVLLNGDTLQGWVDRQIAQHQHVATVNLATLPWYLKLAHSAAYHLPTSPVAAIGAVFGIIAALAILGNI